MTRKIQDELARLAKHQEIKHMAVKTKKSSNPAPKAKKVAKNTVRKPAPSKKAAAKPKKKSAANVQESGAPWWKQYLPS